MKKNLFFGTKTLFPKNQVSLFFLFVFSLGAYAQVNFTQTTDADFNQGALNSAVVSGENIYLQNAAGSVGNWLTTTVLPQPLAGHKTVSWNDRYVYLVGGYNNSTYSSSVYYSGINSGGVTGWTSLPSLPAGLKDAAVVIGTNTIYVIGGRNASQVFNTVYYASINYDGTIGSWQTSAVTLPTALWGHTAAYVNGYIYVAGGTSVTTENTASNSVYYAKVKADNSISTFSPGTNLPAERNRHSMVNYNNRIYILGGYNNSGTRANTVYYATPGPDGSTGAWTNGTSLPLAISNHSSVVTNGLIMVLAGATNAGLSNTAYYANVDQPLPWTWVTSPNIMYDLTKDGSAFKGNGVVIHTGGTNLSGAPIVNSRCSNLAMTSNFVKQGTFVSSPFYQLGAERIIDSLTFHSTYDPSFANCQVSYRTADTDGDWSDWTALTSVSPIMVNQTKQYLQYSVILTGQGSYNAVFHDMTLSTRGSQLSGYLNEIPVFTKEQSPYWVTSDIYFTSGTHTFEAGTTLLFLPQTGMYVGQANIVCNGTEADSVKFLYYTSGTGLWKGLRFDPNSDNGVSSQFNYTVIADAGYGDNNANLVCDQTSEPYLMNCKIRNADGFGLHLYYSNIIVQNSVIQSNTEHGVYLYESNPTIISSSISHNGAAGVYLNSTSSKPTFSATTIDHNLYGLYYPSPNFTFTEPLGSPTLIDNTYNGLVMGGGTINGENKVWNSISYDYFLLGTINVVQWHGNVRLTIEQGNRIKAANGVHIYIGKWWEGYPNYGGGELYAMGTQDHIITFTSFNDQPGGWEGIYFTPQSDDWGGHSQLDYCVIEKGNEYNYYAESTVQPDLVNNCIIQNAVGDGAKYSNSSGVITNSQFLNNGNFPLMLMSGADPTHHGNTYLGNGNNRIALSERNYSSDKTFHNEGVPYYFMGDLVVYQYYQSPQPTLTIKPGTTLEFAPGKKLQIGGDWPYPACLKAEGTPDSIITFKPYNDSIGGWGGIYFANPDDYGGISTMKYCKVEKGASYNLYCEYSDQPQLSNCEFSQSAGVGIQLSSSSPSIGSCTINGSGSIGMQLSSSNPTLNNCIISNSGSHGIVESSSSASIQNCQFLNNNGYPLKYNNWSSNSYLQGNTWIGNTINYIAISGGDSYENRTLYNEGIGYHVLDNIRIMQKRITIEPGVTLAFSPEKYLQVGWTGWGIVAELFAEGNADSIITFKPFNETIGGWNGIYFNNYADEYGSVSSMKYCKVEKGLNYNLYCESSNQPSIQNCEFSQSAGVGIQLSSSNPTLNNCIISNSGSHGIVESSSSASIQNCQFLNNNGYPLKYNNWSSNSYLQGNTWIGNTINYIAISGGDSYENRTLYNEGIGYHVLDNIRIMQKRITIEPGVTLAFAPEKYLQVGWTGWGIVAELFAEGKADSIITFKPFNETIGGWNGIYFNNYADEYGSVSSMKYCKVEKGLNYNLYCESSNQPQLNNCEFSQSAGVGIQLNSSSPSIDSCIISNSGSHGIVESSSSASIQNCQFLNNNGYPLKYNDWNCNSFLQGNTWIGNTINYIALAGGDSYENRTVYNDGIGYHVLDDLRIMYNRVTIQPGVVLAFEPGKRLQVGTNWYGIPSDFYAEGNADSIIHFKPFNDSIGGWGGLYFPQMSSIYGSTSSLKYCKIEKAADNNIVCENTNQPLMEHCELTQSSGNGLKLYSSPLTIRNSSFTHNATHGILVEGYGSPLIGNSPGYSCNLYYNGGQNVYNNSPYNIDARHNFWASRDSIEIKSNIYDKHDNASFGQVFIRPFIHLPYLSTDTMSVSGVILYSNAVLNAMENAALKITDSANVTVNTAATNMLGEYAFAPVQSGSYYLNISPVETWGGVNSTDALRVLNHFAHISLLSGINLAAADVNASNTVNATDALFIMNRFVGITNSFPAGNAFMEIDTVIVDNSDIINDLKMLWFGDVNNSYEPPANKEVSSVTLEQEGSIIVSSFAEFNLPVRLQTANEFGAISLGFYFPEEFFEIVGVEPGNGIASFTASTNNGLTRLAWCDLNPVFFNDNEMVVNLKVRSLDLSGLMETIVFGIYEESELANIAGQELSGVTLTIPGIQTLSVGIADTSKEFSLKVHPNPFKEYTTINFALVNESKVSIDLIDLFGKQIKPIAESLYTAGSHQIILNRESLAPSVYFLKIDFRNSDETFSKMIKVVVSN